MRPLRPRCAFGRAYLLVASPILMARCGDCMCKTSPSGRGEDRARSAALHANAAARAS
ncbi:hypothetical protein GLE_3223 [Lysobacter enzymogenes]|uniref:Lipoprotein n=1 Tax=Lysobacter enzymogenes TaxID=69 RepID=A0A0S2DJH1_LYSEN|nr:hypothetical protein GLE_3223 [Lysobacter enzymogenes]